MNTGERLTPAAVAAALCAVFAAVPAGAQAWQSVPGLDASAPPAIASHVDGKLYLAGVALGGAMAYATTSKPGAWSPKATIPGTPSAGLAADPTPVFVNDGGLLYLFARGYDNELYETVKGSGSFSSWSRWTSDGRVRGRISASVTHPAVDLLTGVAPAPEIHVVHASGPDSVLYRSFHLNGGLASNREWLGVSDGAIGSNGNNGVAVALRRTGGMDMWSGLPGLRGGRTWTHLGTRAAAGSEGEVTDISNVAYFNGAFHVAYSLRTLAGGTATLDALQLQHARFRIGVADDRFARLIASTHAPAAPLPSELRIYRNKLMLAFRDSTGVVRYARWDAADPSAPWVGGPAIGAADRATGRPSLATMNSRGRVSDFTQPGYGDDLFAAIQGFEGFAEARFYFTNFSQQIARIEAAKQIGIFNAYYIAGVLSNGNQICAPTTSASRVSLKDEARPVLSEIGQQLWMLPNWLSSHIFGEFGALAWSEKSPYFAYRSSALLPLVLMCSDPADKIFVNDFGAIWVRVNNDSARIFEEFGHTLSSAIGFHDDSEGPDSKDAARSGIALAVLKDGYSLFGSKSKACPDPDTAGRCVGFTVNQYEWWRDESPSRQHHFIYPLLYYVSRGDDLRQWIQQDVDGTNTATQGTTGERFLLQRKYNWIRWNVFRGVEFGQNGVLKTSL